MKGKAFTGNASDPEQVRDAGRKVRDRRKQELNDIRAILDMQAGRRFFWRLINEICHYDALSAQNSGSLTYLSEGERNVGRIIKGEAYEAAFDAYQLMEREYMSAKFDNVTADFNVVKKEDANG